MTPYRPLSGDDLQYCEEWPAADTCFAVVLVLGIFLATLLIGAVILVLERLHL